MKTQFTFAFLDGRPVVIENRPNGLTIYHTFLMVKQALSFYEQNSSEPFTQARRDHILQQYKLAARGRTS